ncbi:LPS export ABC transporter permease LptG [Lichenihabitans sp. PAMC28606]|uniref:LPS export ABC transporter permease LptG n=1 Tax=Lichenihabitans sp. PAMC28606 TaxID=2880932 RepID=UPI001D0B8837|nr:LPS export ABC transporter permease LptG [Lichenihabitans sp. PAMC28606]UDL95225.1 LPS export ABC transporter permease LptG [Lichenihabitans sp. PAMC28606]
MIGPTLTRYFSVTFARTVLSVFGLMFLLIYLLDFVEMLRRASDAKGSSTLLVAFLSLLRVPSVSEQVMPFAVLFGAMFAFINLTRKLELVVARAAGMSVWQFMLPPVAVALAIGIVATTIYNPISALSKRQADRLELKLFGAAGASEKALWLRQKSIDGQAIIRADHAEDGGTSLTGVTAFVFEPDGSFQERVNAKSAELEPGFWSLIDAHIISPDDEPQDSKTFLLATNLTADQVSQSFEAPEGVPFWSLPAFQQRTEQAGLDATAYRLRYQTLLARPLLLVTMVLIAASFSLRFFRFGGVAKMVSGGVAAGFVLYVATTLIGDLGGAGILSAPVAAWSPAIVGSMLATFVLLQQEDG